MEVKSLVGTVVCRGVIAACQTDESYFVPEAADSGLGEALRHTAEGLGPSS